MLAHPSRGDSGGLEHGAEGAFLQPPARSRSNEGGGALLHREKTLEKAAVRHEQGGGWQDDFKPVGYPLQVAAWLREVSGRNEAAGTANTMTVNGKDPVPITDGA